jgi:phage I-like protein
MSKTDEAPRFLIALAELPEGLVPIPILKKGSYYKGKQKFSLTDTDVQQLVGNFRKRQNGEVVIDYEHASERPEVAKGDAIPAAGWLKAMSDAADGDGILWGQAELTDKARGMIAAKEYKYLSPFIDRTIIDKQTGKPQGSTLTSIALTNRPFLEAMPAIALSDGWVVETATEKEKSMPVKRLVLTDRATSMVRAILEDNSETVLAVEGLAAEPKIVRLSDVKRTADGRFDFIALSEVEEGTVIAKEVIHAINVQSELDAAVQTTKITPAQRPLYEKLALSDLGSFRKLVATLPAQLDLTERGIGGEGEGGIDLQKALGKLIAERIAAQPNLNEGQARQLVLSEHADLRKQIEGATNPTQTVVTLVAEKRAANKDLKYGDALRLVLSEHADLAKAWHDATPGFTEVK